MKIINLILDIISPGWCVSCNRPVRREERFVCETCKNDIRFVDECCPICSGVLIDDKCEICGDREIYFDQNIAVMEYEHTVKALIGGYKFGSRKRMAELIANLCMDKASELLEKTDCITSVPSSPKKKWKRGFNQSEEIARIIARKSNIQYIELLNEIGHAEKQKSLGFSNRFLNVLGRYDLSKKAKSFAKCSVLIVDDVFTTGATINECARILKNVGFNPIFSLTAARVGIKRLEK